VVRYEGHTAGVFSVVIAPDGRHFLSGGKDGTVRLWPLPK
jgi:WD40 repeat protein